MKGNDKSFVHLKIKNECNVRLRVNSFTTWKTNRK